MPYIDIHTHKKELLLNNISIVNTDVLEDKKPFRNLFSAGIHPWNIEKGKLEMKKETLQKFVKSKNLIAIGECGLDKLIDTPLLTQLEVFNWHVQLSEKHRKPLIVHCVRAFNELIETRKATKATLPWIIHGFDKKENILNDVIKKGFHVSFGEALLNEKSNAFKYFKDVPNHLFFLETDISEHSIEEIYEKAAILKQISVSELKEIIYNNYNRIFNNG